MDPAQIKLTVKVGTVLVGALMTIWSLHGLSFGGGGAATSNLLRSGVTGICADQAATAAAAGDGSSTASASATTVPVLDTSGLPAADQQAMAAALGTGSLNCSPSTKR